MSDHAKLSPSARHRWGACPGSVREEAKYPEPPSGEAAIDGTHTHTLLETCLKDSLPAAHFIGWEMADDDGTFKVDKERAERVQVALNYVNMRISDLDNDVTIQSESQVSLNDLTFRDDLYGTVDITIVGGGVLEIIDYKDGMSPVNVEGNPQLEQYGLGKLTEYIDDKSIKRVRTTIIQPKMRVKGINPIQSVETDVDEFMKNASIIMKQAAATDEPDAPLVPGESQCRYCRAKGACSALAEQTMKSSGIVFANLEVAQQSADKDPNTMSDDQIRELLEAAPLIRQMLEGVEAEALRRLEAGHSISGLKVVKGRGSRSWMYDDDMMAEKLKKMGVPKAALWVTKLISPAQAEKVTWEKRDKTVVGLSERQLKVMQSEYIKKSDGKLTVALESDDRPAVTVSAAGMFAPVVEAPVVPSWLTQS